MILVSLIPICILLHPQKYSSPSVLMLYAFMLNFASKSPFVHCKNIWRRFVTFSIAKTTKLHYIKTFFLLSPLLFPQFLQDQSFLSLCDLKTFQVAGGAVANPTRFRLPNSSHVASSRKWNQTRDSVHTLQGEHFTQNERNSLNSFMFWSFSRPSLSTLSARWTPQG